jgi:phage shock protein A
MKTSGVLTCGPTSIVALMMLVTSGSTPNNNNYVEAFAPIHHSQSQVRSDFHHPAAAAASGTALHFSLLDRVARVSRANLSNVLQRFEDPEKVMNQALEDMQGDLIRVRQTYAEVTATQRRMAHSQFQLESQATDWHRRAELALRNSNEGLAREALARREALLNQARAVQGQIDGQASNIDVLYEGMQALERKIAEARGRKNEMASRARTAKSTQKLNDMLSGLTGRTSMDAFIRMEEKVLALEAAAEVSAEMARNTMYQSLLPPSKKDAPTNSSSDVELQFRMLEASDSVDRELEKMKMNILPAASDAPATQKVSIKIKDIDYVTRAIKG